MKAYSNNEDSSQGFWGTRFTFAVMAFLGFVITFVNRVELSVAIVAMVKRGMDSYTFKSKRDDVILG
jgi:hypothetical protein